MPSSGGGPLADLPLDRDLPPLPPLPPSTRNYGATDNNMDISKGPNPLGESILLEKVDNKTQLFPRPDVIILNLVVPPFLFTLLVWTLGSQIRFSNPSLCINFVVIISIMTVAILWFSLFLADRMKSFGVLVTAAVVLGTFGGEMNYKWNLQPVYTMQAMAERRNINPKEQQGGAVSDSGKVWFTEGSYVDTDKGMSYRSEGINYCAAPITLGSDALASYGFWAVGVDCCTTDRPTFTHCMATIGSSGSSDGSGSSIIRPAGLRLMYPEQYGDFRLAVAQAESAYNLAAPEKPLFFYWVSDPSKEASVFLLDGVKAKVVWSISYFLLSLVLSPIVSFILH